MVLTAIILLLILSCSKKNITNNYYPSSDKGRIVGFVYPPKTGIKVIAYLGTEVIDTHIDTTGFFELNDLPLGGFTILVKGEEYRDYKTYVWVSGSGTVVLDTIFLSSIHDLISYVYPSDGAEGVRLHDRIRITFRNLMNSESVENAFLVEPELEGDFYWYSSGKSTALEFVPKNQFGINTTYSVTIDTTASDTEGVRLSEPYRFSFTTELFRIQTHPINKETWVDPNTSIYVYFNAAMDEESVVLAFKMVDSNFKDVSGKFYWRYLQNMDFVPDSTLAYNEIYTVTIDTNAKAISGGSLEQPYNFWFKTRPY